MARLILKALRAGGYDAHLTSRVRTLDLAGDPDRQKAFAEESAAEVDRLLRGYAAAPETRPEAWVTYHVYYKAPDWIGPAVAQALGIPYAIVEGSRSPKRAEGPWAFAHAAAKAALDRADVVFHLTEKDRDALQRFRPAGQRLIKLPPFVDAEDWPESDDPPRGVVPSLLTVAMMRPGDKLASYRLLAEALAEIEHLPWTLHIVGDGAARPEVEEAFSRFKAPERFENAAFEQTFGPPRSRVRFSGLIDDPKTLAALYSSADLFVWPAVNEAFGMVFLEAQACGLPVVAGRFGGTADVILHEETGLLVDPAMFGPAVRVLLDDPERRRRFSIRARDFARTERTVAAAAEILRRGMEKYPFK